MPNVQITITLFFCAVFTYAYGLDRNSLRMGIEISLQDEEMANENGPAMLETPHKEKKLKEFSETYIARYGLPLSRLIPIERDVRKNTKPGYSFIDDRGETHSMTLDPGCIEVNSGRNRLEEIRQTSAEIIAAGKEVGLKPAFRSMGLGSGGLHFHVGGETYFTNPFYRYPNLARNMLALYFSSPALQFAFNIPYDEFGIATYPQNNHQEPGALRVLEHRLLLHHPLNQRKFRNALDKFDRWYLYSLSHQDQIIPASNILDVGLLPFNFDLRLGLRAFLTLLNLCGLPEPLFTHRGFLNLENLAIAANPHPVELKDFAPIPGYKAFSLTEADFEAKVTGEFRVFRPVETAEQIEALAGMLVTLMEHMARPEHLERLSYVSRPQYDQFQTPSYALEDWENMKKRFPELNKPLLNNLVREYFIYFRKESSQYPIQGFSDAKMYDANEVGFSGTNYEITIPYTDESKAPSLMINGRLLRFKKMNVSSRLYWVAAVNSEKYNFSRTDAMRGDLHLVPTSCAQTLSSISHRRASQ